LLQNLVAPGSGWTLDQATQINDDGQIAGIGVLNGVAEAYLLTPVPEPGSITCLGFGIVYLLKRPRRITTSLPD
jgi:hypothetical protein